MKKINSLKSSVISSILVVVLASFLICSPLLHINNMRYIFRIFMGCYGLIQFIQFLILYSKKDYANFFSFLISIGLLIASFMIDLTSTPKMLAFSLLLWVAVLALVKLAKADYYHDRKSKIWYMEICFLVLFLLSGTLTALSFAHEVETQIIVLGYFALICGILETGESLLLYLTKGTIK